MPRLKMPKHMLETPASRIHTSIPSYTLVYPQTVQAQASLESLDSQRDFLQLRLLSPQGAVQGSRKKGNGRHGQN